MAKKARKIAPQILNQTDTDLRRWCIEQAIRWPTSGGYGQGGVASVGGYVPVQEHNIIDRAEHLMKWVTKA